MALLVAVLPWIPTAADEPALPSPNPVGGPAPLAAEAIRTRPKLTNPLSWQEGTPAIDRILPPAEDKDDGEPLYKLWVTLLEQGRPSHGDEWFPAPDSFRVEAHFLM